ncbi:hypothetical protein [Bradyrhizobium diazoefficiens]
MPLAATAAAIAIVAIIVAGTLFLSGRYDIQPFEKKTESASTLESKSRMQTEVFFLNGLNSQPDATDEWWSARSDHRLLAYAVFDCKRLPDVSLEAMPRQYFSALLLDTTPTGNHAFFTKDGEDAALAARDKDTKPFVLSAADQEVLSLSDSIVRSRMAAADGANSNMPWVQRLGLTTVVISALATLFVTLQGKTRAVELTDDEKKTLDRATVWVRTKYVLVGPGSAFRWVAFLAIALSIVGTSLTGLKQVYDPTRILNQNTRALLDLRQLHQEVILSVKCDPKENQVSVDPNKLADWRSAIRRMRATIVPGYGAYANLDVGGSSPRLDPIPNRGQEQVGSSAGEDSQSQLSARPPAKQNKE